MKQLILLCLSVAVIATSCNIVDSQRVKGNSNINSRSYELKNFSSIDVGDNATIYLKQDSVYSVKVETDDNLFQYLIVDIEDGELNVDVNDGYNLDPSKELKVYISMPSATKIAVSGSATLNLVNDKFTQDQPLSFDISGASDGSFRVKAPSIKLDVSGASTFTIAGETKDVSGEISGASTLKAYDLKAETSNMDASGASTANIFASIQLTADASGASSIRYKGNPKVNSTANGAGSVKQAD